MAEFRAAVTINRPREEVHRYLSDANLIPVWQSGLQEFDADWDDQPRVGDRSRATVKVAGKKVRSVTEVTEVSPDHLAIRSVEAPFAFEMSYRAIDRGGHTEVVHEGTTESLGGFFGKLADPIVARMYQRDVESNLKNLKALLEETGG